MTTPMTDDETGRVVEEIFSTKQYTTYKYKKHRVVRGSKLYDLVWDFPEIEHLFEIVQDQETDDGLPVLRIED